MSMIYAMSDIHGCLLQFEEAYEKRANENEEKAFHAIGNKYYDRLYSLYK